MGTENRNKGTDIRSKDTDFRNMGTDGFSARLPRAARTDARALAQRSSQVKLSSVHQRPSTVQHANASAPCCNFAHHVATENTMLQLSKRSLAPARSSVVYVTQRATCSNRPLTIRTVQHCALEVQHVVLCCNMSRNSATGVYPCAPHRTLHQGTVDCAAWVAGCTMRACCDFS